MPLSVDISNSRSGLQVAEGSVTGIDGSHSQNKNASYTLDMELDNIYLAQNSDEGELMDIMELICDAKRDRQCTQDAFDENPINIACIGVHITEVLKQNHSRAKESKVRPDKLSEIKSLKERKV